MVSKKMMFLFVMVISLQLAKTHPNKATGEEAAGEEVNGELIGRTSEPTGEDVCEGRNLGKTKCLEVGCCHWNDWEFPEGRCFSDVGQQLCY